MRIQNNQSRSYSYDEKNPIYKGQNSSIYNAVDEMFNRRVCLKIITGVNDGASVKREVIALARAGAVSTHVPMVLDYWMNNKNFFIVMQLIDGATLRTKLKVADRKTFNDWMISICDTLGSVHGAHIFHKDIKPENIVITSPGDAYLIDFNISIAKPNLNDGTEFYRAPEMSSGGIAIARNQSDIFSLGVMMYEYYTGTRPVEGVNYGADMFGAAASPWGYFTSPNVLKPDMPKLLSDIIEKCMKRNPAERYKQASELKRELIRASREIRGWKN